MVIFLDLLILMLILRVVEELHLQLKFENQLVSVKTTLKSLL